MTNTDVADYKPPSTFVNITAWIFIVLSGLGILVGVLQNLLFAFLLQQEEFSGMFKELEQEGMPVYMSIIFENLQAVLLVSLLLTILLFTASIGLLKRKNWARRIFVSYLFVFSVYLIIGSMFQHIAMSDMMGSMTPDTKAPSSFQIMMEAMQYIALAFNIGLGILFGWLGWKLIQPTIKEEFVPS